jgi:hypothetical protein
MLRPSRVVCIVALTVWAIVSNILVPSVALAEHPPFLFKLDRFEVTGQGAFLDEFDDGVLSGSYITLGTVTEADGYAVLSSPGYEERALSNLRPITLERSDIGKPFLLIDGGGNFLATQTWAPILPNPPRDFFGLWWVFQVPGTRCAGGPSNGQSCTGNSSCSGAPIGFCALNPGTPCSPGSCPLGDHCVAGCSEVTRAIAVYIYNFDDKTASAFGGNCSDGSECLQVGTCSDGVSCFGGQVCSDMNTCIGAGTCSDGTACASGQTCSDAKPCAPGKACLNGNPCGLDFPSGLTLGLYDIELPSILTSPGRDVTFEFNAKKTVSIAPSDITGNIVFRLSFEDATNLLTPSVSLNGGTSFLSPFDPVPVSLVSVSTSFIGALADPPNLFLAQSKGQQKCVNAMNKDASAVAQAQNKANLDCLKKASSGGLEGLGVPPQTQTAQACLTNDVGGKVGKKVKQVSDHDLKSCLAPWVQPPDFAHTSAATVTSSAQSAALQIVAKLFGAELTAVSSATDKAGAACQQQVLKTTKDLFATLWKTVLIAKKNALKGKNVAKVRSAEALQQAIEAELAVNTKVADAALKLDETTGAVCGGPGITTIAGMFPGDCSGSANTAALSACARRVARCRFCRSLNGADGISVDCDAFDNAAADASCS